MRSSPWSSPLGVRLAPHRSNFQRAAPCAIPAGPRSHAYRHHRSMAVNQVRLTDRSPLAGTKALCATSFMPSSTEGRRTLAIRLGAMMRLAGSDLLSDADCVVPVPLHPWRRLMRGFNQAADLAARLERPVVPALWRTRATAPQTGLTAAGRRRNVRGAFSLSPLFSQRVRDAMLVDRVVVLVDDVRTTGATLEACARVLKDAGAREVRALTTALADARDHTS